MNGDLENRVVNGTKTFFTGPMCAGKSLELIKINGQMSSIDQHVYAFVQTMNDSKKSEIVSRLNRSIPAIKVSNSGEILSEIEKKLWHYVGKHTDEPFIWDNVMRDTLKKQGDLVVLKGMLRWKRQHYVLIDEVSFFDNGIIDTIQKLSYCGVNVFAGGLEHDFRGELFRLNGGKTVSEIAGICDEHKKLTARCQYQVDGAYCGDEAIFTQRFKDVEHKEASHYNDELIVTDKRLYAPVCREHHYVPGKFS